ncbi:hypothetical protein ACLMJK_008388 [Lecanora helva]
MFLQRFFRTNPHKRYRRNYLFRSFGLELPTLLTFGSPAKEVPKPVYRLSLKGALSNSAVHILPILASLTTVILNLKTIYVGRTLTGQIESAAINIAMLQVTAKLVELLAVASLTSIVVHTIRKELVLGGGVPLGAVSGAFMFSSLSYFWSPELWGSFRSKLSWSAKARIYGTLILAGLLAVTIGPSTAVLLIPREQDWIAGGSDIYIRGSPDEVWPSRIEFSPSGIESFCSFPNATSYGMCPSGGYQSMLPYRTTAFQRHNFLGFQRNLSSFVFGPTGNLISSTYSQLPGISLVGNWRSIACETTLSGISGAEAIYTSQLLRDWQQIVLSIPYAPLTTSISEYKYTNDLTGIIKSRVPVVRVACSDAQNISSTSNLIDFPFLPDGKCWNSTKAFEYKNLNQKSSENIRTTWITLPEQFGRVSAGLLFEGPWISGSSRVVSGCSIDARWANATLSTKGSMRNPGTASSLVSVSEASLTDLAPGQTSDWPMYSDFRPVNNASWSPIQLQQSWLDVLTPSIEIDDIPGGQSRQVNTLESLLRGAIAIDGLLHPNLSQTTVWNSVTSGSLNRTITLEWTLATVVADGLSREGSARVLNTTGDPMSWTILDYNKTADFSKQLLGGASPLEEPVDVGLIKRHASIKISGYSYKASVLTDYLSVSIVIIYMLLALCHTIELILRRQVSACWDTITELFALMQNSRPATVALKNTCAGIKELGTYAQVAIIRALQPGSTASATDVPHLEVIFQDESDGPVEMRNLSDDASSMKARLLDGPNHSKTWAAGTTTYLDSSSTTGHDWRHSEQGEWRERDRSKSDVKMSRVEVDTLYG